MQFEPEKALADAMGVFWIKGYESTSLQDLLQATGLSKSSLYQTFGNKHALFERCLTHYRDTFGSSMAARLDAAHSGAAFLREVLMSVAAEGERSGPRRGCLLMNTATEFAGRDPRIAKEVSAGTHRMRDIFEAAVVRAQRDGEISADASPRALAQFFITTISGMRTMVKARASRQELESTAEIALMAMG